MPQASFAWRSVLLFGAGLSIVLTLNIMRQHQVIDAETEGLLRLGVNGVLGTMMVYWAVTGIVNSALRLAMTVPDSSLRISGAPTEPPLMATL